MKELTIDFNGEEIKIFIIRKKVKNVNLRVKCNGEVIVTANNNVSDKIIIKFINKKIQFIKNNLEKFKNIRELPINKKVDKNNIKYLGKIYKVKFIEKVTKDCNYKVSEDYICIYIKNINNENAKEKAISKFYSNKSKEIFEKAYAEVHKLFGIYNIPPVDINIRKMKSRWGSCMPLRRKITLNRELIKLPYSCIQFVIAHELAHLVQPNHSKEFYKVLSNVMIDWKDRKKIMDKVYLN